MISDNDPEETAEWLDAAYSVTTQGGKDRLKYLLTRIADKSGISSFSDNNRVTPYRNTISAVETVAYPGDIALETKIENIIRWNAMAIVVRAQMSEFDLGGHIGTFASSSTLYNVGFNHFFRGRSAAHLGDLIYIQGHASPGIYARSFLMGDLTETQLEHFRLETDGAGLSSYPHPWLMPDYWQFPTVSMGLGPLQAIYQARFMRYLEARGLTPPSDRKVWCFCGDGEMDEPESVGALSIASRESLDNLIFVINCNLQRLDGPVRGNGKIIQELESIFRGAGWDVIKTVWGSGWDPLFAIDQDGLMQKRMEEAIDGDYQNFKARGGAYTREHFFGKYPELKNRVAHLSDEEIGQLKRGGHDSTKVFAAFDRATRTVGKPVVILAKTVKGYGLGKAGEARNTAHNTKKLKPEDLKAFRDRFEVPISDAELETIPFYKPKADSPEMQYLKACRERLHGPLPKRYSKTTHAITKIPSLETFAPLLESTGERQISTTMAFVRILGILCKDPEFGPRVVPIVPDEARTFGMEGLFRQIGIYSAVGQNYVPVDSEEVMSYREMHNGQILEEGINEAGSFCSWMAAATSYANHDVTTIPFYIYYSMFGFQRIGDLAWAAGDLRSRGFLLGGTAGRTTLNGEGLQHQDGHSHILAGTIPNCVTYDPTFSYELAVIIQHGFERMLLNKEDVFFYITVMNENYLHPKMPEGCQEGIIRGLYRFKEGSNHSKKVQLLGSGTILNEVIAAAELLEAFEVSSDVWSVTSFNELRKEALTVARNNHFHPSKKPQLSYVEQCLGPTKGPIIAATDYMRSYADSIRSSIPGRYVVLGTDGFGRSDSRANLRRHFEVDRYYIAYAALKALWDDSEVPLGVLQKAMKAWNIDSKKADPRFV